MTSRQGSHATRGAEGSICATPSPVVPFEKEVIGNPLRYISRLSQEEYDSLKTTTFAKDGYVEIHYVDDRKEGLFKQVEKYCVREDLINPLNMTLLQLWNKLPRYLRFEFSFKSQSAYMFATLYMDSKLFKVISQAPMGFQIGFMTHLKSQFVQRNTVVLEHFKKSDMSNDELEHQLMENNERIKDMDALRSFIYISC
jgi:hypothetical protein